MAQVPAGLHQRGAASTRFGIELFISGVEAIAVRLET